MSALLQDTPEVQAAYEEYRRFTADPAMRAKAKMRERFMIEQQLNRNEALEEGLAKGEAKKAKETARKMKARALIPL